MNPLNPSRHARKVLLGDRQCTATNRDGTRCGRASALGQFICDKHGAKAPLSIAEGNKRLARLVEPVLATFEEILAAWHRTTCTGCGHVDEHGVKCTGCGKPTGDPMPVIRVGQLVLDRAGFHPSVTVEQVAPPNPYDDLSEDELIEKLETMLEQVRATRDDRRAHALPEAVDAVLLDAFIVPDDDGA